MPLDTTTDERKVTITLTLRVLLTTLITIVVTVVSCTAWVIRCLDTANARLGAVEQQQQDMSRALAAGRYAPDRWSATDMQVANSLARERGADPRWTVHEVITRRLDHPP